MTKMTGRVLAAAAVALMTGTAAHAADLRGQGKTVEVAPPAPSMFDIAFGGGIQSDYNFRGISQTDRGPGVFAYFEPRLNVLPWLQAYAGIAGYSIEFPNRASAEIDLYGGIRPTFGKLSLDFGGLYYWYPSGQCFNTTVLANGTNFGADCVANGNLPVNGNVIKEDLSFFEIYAKASYAFTDWLSVGGNVFYADNWLNSGATGTYYSGTAKITFPTFANGVGWYVSGELGHYVLGTTDLFYASPNFPNGTPLPDYTTWNLGVGFTWKAITLDLRYHDTDLNKGDCNALTGDHTARGGPNGFVTAVNPGGFGSNWCGEAFVAKLSFDLTASSLK